MSLETLIAELLSLIKGGEIPTIIAIGTAVFLHLYLKSERSKPPAPEWVGPIRKDIAKVGADLSGKIDGVRADIVETKRQFHHRQDQTDVKLAGIQGTTTENRTLLNVISTALTHRGKP